ncbi:MAG TPA: hypothetical protein VKV06_12080 [Acidimicrobiales bacterium]|nr:hypothetical protein [Acidimicrobiales bacterium]
MESVSLPPDARRAATEGALSWTAIALLGAAGLELAALLPGGRQVAPMADSAPAVAGHVVLAAGLALAGGLCTSRQSRPAVAGTMLATGIVLADVGVVLSDCGNGFPAAGVWLEVVSLCAAAAGVALGWRDARRRVQLRESSSSHRRLTTQPALAAATALFALVLGVALVPVWNRYDLLYTALGRSEVRLPGGIFASGTPTIVAVGTLLTGLVFVAVPVVSLWWRPARLGILATGGVLLVAASQMMAALAGMLFIGAGSFLPHAEAADVGLVVHASLTSWFDLEVVAGVGLLVFLVVRWWTPPDAAIPDEGPAWVPAAAPRTQRGRRRARTTDSPASDGSSEWSWPDQTRT